MDAAELAAISEHPFERPVNPHLSNLATSLVTRTELRCGHMLAKYTPVALVSENRVLCHPASVDNVPAGPTRKIT
jgi:histidine ammonia-lyase